MNKEQTARKNIFKKSKEISGSSIRGFDFNKDFYFNNFLNSYKFMGEQASNLHKAIEIFKKMKQQNAFIYLGYTSNMVTSGNRDIIRYLVEHKLVDVLVTTAGGIEEDFLKCFGDFKLGDFNANGSELRKNGINRAGNIYIPNSRYCKFEDFIIPIFKEIYDNQVKNNVIITPNELIKILGKKIDNKDSIYYWAYKNNIPVFCPAITDGSIGDMIYFFKNKYPDFRVDVSDDIVNLNNSTIGKSKTGVIILGGGVIKHHILNANMFRNGADYAIYINSNPEFDGSDSGALPEEAKSWGKLLSGSENVKVFCDATIAFPILISSLYKK